MYIVDSIEFQLLNPNTIRKKSVCEIFDKRTYRGRKCRSGGVLDERLGCSHSHSCQTCGHDQCENGHFGHIVLQTPVFDLKYISTIQKILKQFCIKCRSTYSKQKCEQCGIAIPKMIKYNPKICCWAMDDNTINPMDVYIFLKGFQDQTVLGFSKSNRAEWMVLTILPVIPVPLRPTLFNAGIKRGESQLTFLLVDILKKNIQNNFVDLQNAVNIYLGELQGKSKYITGVSKRLKGKTGRIRCNIMGKRCNFTARSVITPNPNLKLDEVGVPYEFTKQLSVPEKLTPFNLSHFKNEYVLGNVLSIILGDHDSIINVDQIHKDDLNEYFKVGNTVERKLKNGDIVLFNRQPSLHKMSLMAHYVKIHKDKTFQLNLSVTTPYNADFDGDEMNMHVPQTLEAITEAKILLAVNKQIISPQSNKPVMGIVQDSLLGLYLLCQEKNKFTDEKAMQFLDTPLHTIQEYYSGTELFSCLLPTNLHFHKSGLLIENGSIVKINCMNKSILGAVCNGLLHVIYLDYGASRCQMFIQDAQQLGMKYLYSRGFTIGISDIIVSKNNTTPEGLDLCNMDNMNEYQINSVLNKRRDDVGVEVNKQLSCETNAFKQMVEAGSKGSNINISQIMGMVGQQNLNGQRIKGFGLHNRTLPTYKHSETPDSKGFVFENYMNGLSPTSYFFHAVGGREGLVDTAVKTSETGYLQRKLVKSLENIHIANDNTVRNSDEEIVQILYGEDGLDSCKMRREQWKLLQMDDKQLLDYAHLQDYTHDYDKCKLIQQKYKHSGDDTFVTPINVKHIMSTLRTDSLSKNTIQEYESFKKHGLKLLWTISNKNKKLVDFIDSNVIYKQCRNIDIHRLFQHIIQKLKSSFVERGEMVGVIAAQSIGEPCTQMTLNTFHFAGIASKNVTLGIPRLYELIHCSKNIKTPLTTIEDDEQKVHSYLEMVDQVYFKDIILKYEMVDSHTIEIISNVCLEENWNNYIIYFNIDVMKKKRLVLSLVVEFLYKYMDVIYIVEYSEDDTDHDMILKIQMEKTIHIDEVLEIMIKGIHKCDAQKKNEHVSELSIYGSSLYVIADIIQNNFDFYCNDVNAIYNVLGIEATRTVLIQEINNVISFDGSYINTRHITLLVDYMIYNGVVTSINRSGLYSQKHNNPLHVASFEQPCKILTEAAKKQSIDGLKGVSEQLFFGNISSVGFRGKMMDNEKVQHVYQNIPHHYDVDHNQQHQEYNILKRKKCERHEKKTKHKKIKRKHVFGLL